MPVITGITRSQTAAPCWQIWLLPKWPRYPGGTIPDGDEVPLPADISKQIKEIQYTSRRKSGLDSGMDTFEIHVANPSLQLLDTPWFQEGNVIQMQWGYSPDNLCPVKTGVINGIDPTFPQEGEEPFMVVKGTCLASPMAGRQRWGLWTRVNRGELVQLSEYFGIGEWRYPDTPESGAQEKLGYSPSEIAFALAEAYGLKTKIAQTGPIKPWWQCGISDWEFLKRLASECLWSKGPDDLDFRFWVEDDTLHFHPVKANAKKETLMELWWYGDDTGMVKQINIRHDTQLMQGAAVETTELRYDPRRMTPRGFIATSRTVGRVALGTRTTFEPGAAATQGQKNQFYEDICGLDMPEEMLDRMFPETHDKTDPDSDDPLKRSIVSGEGDVKPGMTEDESVEKGASDRFNAENWEGITATALIIGWPTFESEKLVDLQGIGSKYSGLWEIDEVVHTLNRSGYECTLKLVRNAMGESDGKYDRSLVDFCAVEDSPGEKIGQEPVPMIDVLPPVAGGGS